MSRPRTPSGWGLAEDQCVIVSSRRGSLEVPVHVDPALRPGLVFMTFHFPDQVDTNVLTIEATDPKSGTAEFKASAVRIDTMPADRVRSRAGAGSSVPAVTSPRLCPRRRPRRRCRGPPPDGRLATDDERAAVDDLLGPPNSSWARRRRATEFDHRVARGGKDAREQRDLLLPALHALQARRGMDQPGRPQLRQRTTHGAARRGLRGRHLLRHVQRRGTAQDRRARVRRPGVPHERRRAGLRRPAGPSAEPGAAEGEVTCGARARVSAVRTRARCPGPDVGRGRAGRDVRPGRSAAGAAPRDQDAGGAGVLASHRPAGVVGAADVGTPTGGRRSDCCVASGSSTRPRSTTTGLTAGTRRCGSRSSTDRSGPCERSPTRSCMGRGGAAFPTGVKWKAVAEQPVHPHYFICNADESEPGTFKDRVVMEQDPFAVIEALTIAGRHHRVRDWATCTSGVSTPWRPAPGARHRRRLGVTGSWATTSWATASTFDIELRRGAGAYICGEETALFNSLEGKRGEPRNKPPFPVQRGRLRQAHGDQQRRDPDQRARGPAHRRPGLRRRSAARARPGTRLFCLSGAVAAPGVYEARTRHHAGRGASSAAGGVETASAEGGAARRRGGWLRGARPARRPADVRRRARRRATRWARASCWRSNEDGRPGRRLPADRAVLPRRVVRPMRAVPGGDRPPGGGAAPSRARPHARFARRRDCRCSTTSPR